MKSFIVCVLSAAFLVSVQAQAADAPEEPAGETVVAEESPRLAAPAMDPCEEKLLTFVKDSTGKPDPDWKGLESYALEEVSASSPDTLCRSRAAFLVADLAPVSSGDSEKLYKRARALAHGVLRSRNEWLSESYRAVPGKLERFVAADANALYWFAISWGHVLDRLNMFSAASQAKDVEAIFLRLHALAPGTEGAGGEVFLGTYYASLPAFFGRNMNKAREFALEAANSPDLNNCRIAVLQGVLGHALEAGVLAKLSAARKAPVDRSRPFAFENLVCQ